MTKKILAMILAVMMVMAMSVTALAATTSNGTVSSTDNYVQFTKQIKVYNYTGDTQEANEVHGPVVNYTFTIAPQDPSDATVTGTVVGSSPATTATVKINQGPDEGALLASASDGTGASSLTVAFNNDPVTTSDSTYATITKDIFVKVDLSKFTQGAGVYRYKIEDTTTDSTLLASGIERVADYSKIRYLDVYITRNSDDSLSVGGYAMVAVTGNVVEGTAKNDGYNTTSDTITTATGSPSADNTDTFNTYNVKVTKDVQGTAGDTTNEFPFAITATDGANGHYIKATGEGVTNVASAIALDATSFTSSGVTLKDDEYFMIFGLSTKDTWSITETNNGDGTYSVAITGSTASSTATDVAIGGTKATGDLAVTTGYTTAINPTITKQNYNVTYTNTMNSISPTGLVLRFAPYIAMLVAGAALFLIMASRRRRNEDED